MPVSLDGEPGVILHTRPYKENSLLVELYTLNFGRVSAVTKLSKKVASRSRGAYQPFILLKLSLFQGKGQLWQLKDVYLQRRAYNFPIPKIFIAQYLNELIFYLLKTHESDPKLFASYIKTLDSLESEGDVLENLRCFELDLLDSLGYGLSFLDDLGQRIDNEANYLFTYEKGFTKVSFANVNTISGQIIKQIELKHYQDKNVQKALKQINVSMINALLEGRKLKSKELYAQYLMV